VILKQGVLNIGDDFVIDSHSVGRVKAMFDMNGKGIKKLLPYQAAKIGGLSTVAKTGAFLEFLPRALASRTKSLYAETSHPNTISCSQENAGFAIDDIREPLRIILKADGYGTAAGLVKAIRLMMDKNSKFKGMVNIVASSIGNVYEKDVLAAVENNAVIFGMNVVVEKNAADLARQNKTTILLESIIYRLVDVVEQMVIEKLKSLKELKLLGKGFVKKVFDIKGRGVIAGCMVTEGSFADKTVVHCFRDGAKIGEARVTSLQQDKRVMKEVIAGQDCGILCQGFSGWREGDKVTCFSEVSLY
jgi:translation initiation factor IF-2